MPKPLDTTILSGFKPRGEDSVKTTGEAPRVAKNDEPASRSWPSREQPSHGSFTIRAPKETIDEFRALCKDDRRTYADMLRILMDAFKH